MVAMIFVVVVALVTVLLQAILLDKANKAREEAEVKLEMDRLLTKTMVEGWELQDKMKVSELDHLWDVHHMGHEAMNNVVICMRKYMDGTADPDDVKSLKELMDKWDSLHEMECKNHEEQMRKRAERDKEGNEERD